MLEACQIVCILCSKKEHTVKQRGECLIRKLHQPPQLDLGQRCMIFSLHRSVFATDNLRLTLNISSWLDETPFLSLRLINMTMSFFCVRYVWDSCACVYLHRMMFSPLQVRDKMHLRVNAVISPQVPLSSFSCPLNSAQLELVFSFSSKTGSSVW